MPGVGIGCSLTVLGTPPATGMPPPPEQQGMISAVVQPAISRLYAGQTIADTEAFTTMVSQDNFVSDTGEITLVEVTPVGDVNALDTPLSEGQTVGFEVFVTDDATPPTTRRFTSALQSVEYDVRILETEGNEARVDINAIVPDEKILTISITGGTEYDGNYTPTAGDLREGPYNFAGTTRITFTGEASQLAAGSTLTHDDGLWSTPTGVLTLTRQGRRNGEAIPNATAADYTLVPEDLGASYDFVVTGDDGTNTPVQVQAPSLIIPAAPAALSVSQLSEVLSLTTRVDPLTENIDTGNPTSGKELFILAAYGKTSSGSNALSVTLDGLSASEITRSSPSNGVNTAIYRIAAPEGGVRSLELVPADGVAWRGASYQVFAVDGHTDAVALSDQNGAFGMMDLSASVTAGARVLGAAGMVDRGTGSSFTFEGLTQTVSFDSQGKKMHAFCTADISSAQTPRQMRITPTGTGSGSVASALLILT